MTDFGFDPTQYDPAEDFAPLPSGKYAVVITESEKKTTRAGNGEFLAFRLAVIDGEYRGRTLFLNLNTQNPSQQATEIGRRQIRSLCDAVGVHQPRDTTQLHNIPFIATVTVKKREDNGEMTNEVKSFAGRNAMQQVPPQEPQISPPQTPQQTTDNTPPWQR